MGSVFLPTSYLAWQFTHTMAGRLEKALGKLGLTLAQYNALNRANDTPGISSAETARRSGVTAQSMGAAISELVDRGLLRREPHPANRRILRLHVTEPGAAILATARETVLGLNAEALRVLTPEEQETVHRLLYRMVEHVNPAVLTD